ncbi:hypothetical protein [Pseudonocardia sp. Ae717_Ps2]|uniref:hypothetical protein n=1 Tax=Pseudonocardia sp. Ae717_Ps2 TaxID=1885573 RepID=UPI001E4D5A6A|nr:hypothetical protein [Pseudonocardia sp. Ae717_Ps2]
MLSALLLLAADDASLRDQVVGTIGAPTPVTRADHRPVPAALDHSVQHLDGVPVPHLTDADDATIYRGPDGDRVIVFCQHANAETGISPV